MTSDAAQSAQIYQWTAPAADTAGAQSEPLRDTVHRAICTYLEKLDGHEVRDLYQIVLGEVEKPLFAAVLDHTGGNQTRAATLLGISRSTLRKKLSHYGLN